MAVGAPLRRFAFATGMSLALQSLFTAYLGVLAPARRRPMVTLCAIAAPMLLDAVLIGQPA